MGINALHLEKIAQIVDESEWLEELDISWNNLVPLHFKPLLEVLSRNKQLKALNLSWNTLIDKDDQNNPFTFSVLSAMD